MTDPLPHERAKNLAVSRVRNALSLPLPEDEHSMGVEGYFDPWEIPGLSAVYGSYDQRFDDAMLEVLVSTRDGEFHNASDLHHDIFREMLCRAGLCDYGTSPRVCFPTQQFKEVLPTLIDKWRAYSQIAWRGGDK